MEKFGILLPTFEHITCDLKNIFQKMSNQTSLLFFADDDGAEAGKDSIHKYLADAGFDPEEVKNWGKIGSLAEALKDDEQTTCHGSELDESFLNFVANLPPGNTPRPIIRHQMQRTPKI